jgi:hypothetical protein
MVRGREEEKREGREREGRERERRCGVRGWR